MNKCKRCLILVHDRREDTTRILNNLEVLEFETLTEAREYPMKNNFLKASILDDGVLIFETWEA